MTAKDETFTGLVHGILRRYCEQNGHEFSADGVMAGVGSRLLTLVEERGLPRPLGADEQGAPGELPEEQCAPLLARALAEISEKDRALLGPPVRQLIKACFHEEFKECRDTFREPSPDGICRRQQLARVRQRVSGTHCIDCPHWVVFTLKTHGEFLKREWQPAGLEEFDSHREIFLPEDFRRLRRWLHARARGRI